MMEGVKDAHIDDNANVRDGFGHAELDPDMDQDYDDEDDEVVAEFDICLAGSLKD